MVSIISMPLCNRIQKTKYIASIAVRNFGTRARSARNLFQCFVVQPVRFGFTRFGFGSVLGFCIPGHVHSSVLVCISAGNRHNAHALREKKVCMPVADRFLGHRTLSRAKTIDELSGKKRKVILVVQNIFFHTILWL